jgi:hypothetical protein
MGKEKRTMRDYTVILWINGAQAAIEFQASGYMFACEIAETLANKFRAAIVKLVCA